MLLRSRQAGGAGGEQGGPGGPRRPGHLRVLQPGPGRPHRRLRRPRPRHRRPAGRLLRVFPRRRGGGRSEEDVIKVAVIGKPNVGKSSLVNRILGEERVIVSDVAGTTRDAVDSYFENEFGKYVFIDTAGMRKKSKVDDRDRAVLRPARHHGHRPLRRVPHPHRRQRGRHRAGHQGGGPGPRGGQGLHHRGQQVGRHREGRQDHGQDARRTCAGTWPI